VRPEHWFFEIPLRLRSLFRRNRVETELNEELQYHLEERTREFTAAGLSPKEARHAAMREFRGLELSKEECRDARKVNWIHDFLQDARYGARMLRNNTGFTVVAVLTLALGIGANTAMFSVVNGVLLQPLPYLHPEQLVVVARTAPRFDHPVPVSGPNFLDWRARAGQFQALAGFDGRGFTVMAGNEPEHVLGAAVSYNFMQVLQVAPVLGRNFVESEEHAGNDHVAIVTDGFWKQHFGGMPDAVGRTLILNGQSFTLVGVLRLPLHLDAASADFHSVESGEDVARR
jgi:MacB-like periplasmic core domain